MNKKRTLVAALILALLIGMLAACGSKSDNAKDGASDSTGKENSANTNNVGDASGSAESLKGKKIALIMEFNNGTFSQQYVDGVKEQVEKLGGKLSIFVAENDAAKMSSFLDSAINQQFDGILTDHGKPEALEPGIKKALEKKIPVLVFDADVKIPGVPVLSQNDQKMAELTLDQLAKDIGGKGNIVKIWVAGFAPMERRQIAYEAFQSKNPDIKEVAAFGAVSASTALDMQAQMDAVLKKFPNKGDISAVWASYDEFAKGAARAIQQAGRDEIKIYGIDMSDEDLQMLQDPKNPWIASAAVDPKDIGRIQVRYLYQIFHGDSAPDSIVLDPIYVSREQLPTDKQVTTAELNQYVTGWGGSEQGYTDWMKDLEKK